ncbi:unnamed protein product [Hymenolepis diminuta]|uniref:Uncharacterized protein n=1 Tax=Hymenolepis diminuta TaxID=6216 RepID=A0A564Y2E8_HYMDI|nr:unnamed protein product [Hymenolepis diminuta]
MILYMKGIKPILIKQQGQNELNPKKQERIKAEEPKNILMILLKSFSKSRIWKLEIQISHFFNHLLDSCFSKSMKMSVFCYGG